LITDGENDLTMLKLIQEKLISKLSSDFDQGVIFEKIFIKRAFVVNLWPSEYLLFGNVISCEG